MRDDRRIVRSDVSEARRETWSEAEEVAAELADTLEAERQRLRKPPVDPLHEVRFMRKQPLRRAWGRAWVNRYPPKWTRPDA